METVTWAIYGFWQGVFGRGSGVFGGGLWMCEGGVLGKVGDKLGLGLGIGRVMAGVGKHSFFGLGFLGWGECWDGK